MSTNEILADLEKEATAYNHTPASYAALDPYMEPILLLRAKYASYEIVTEMLVSRGIKVSEATVRRFCRRHNSEMKRIRTEWANKKKAAAAASVSPQLPLPGESGTSSNPSISNPLPSGVRKITGSI